MKNSDKLTLRWSKKQNDFLINYPLGISTNNDSALLYYMFTTEFNGFKSFIDELKDRGYDTTTLKFSIEPKLPSDIKFKSLTEKYDK